MVGFDLSVNVNLLILLISVVAVLYGCETWSSTLREEHRLRVFENRVLRGIFGYQKHDVNMTLEKIS
jgi:hypothetical protein